MRTRSEVRHKRNPGVAFRPVLEILAGLLICLSIPACSEKKKADPLQLGGVVPWPGYEPLYTARDLGYLDDKLVRLTEYGSNSEVIRGFSNGAIDAGLVTLDEALLLAQDAPDIRIVLIADFSNGGDVIMAKPEITSMKDLKGRRIGAETTALGSYVLMRALQLSGMTPEDLEIVPLEFSEHERAFKEGHIDAVVTFDPTRTKLRNFGAKEIFDSTQIPGEIVDVLVVRGAFLETHPETVKHLAEAFYRGRAYVKEKPQEAARIAAPRAKISPEEFLSSLNDLELPDANETRRQLIGNPPALLGTAQKMAAMMREQGLLRKDIDIELLFNAKGLSTILP